MSDKEESLETDSTEESPIDALGDQAVKLTDQIEDKAEQALDKLADHLPKGIDDAVKEKISDTFEDLDEIKKNLIDEMKETAKGLLDSFFGDFSLFWSTFKTLGKWFIAPVSINVKMVEAANKLGEAEGKKPRYKTDFTVMKNIFGLSLAFLIVEETASGDNIDHWIGQFVFFLFFVLLLFFFIGSLWIWKAIVKIPVKDTRVFVGYLIYQYAAMYLISFTINGPLRMDAIADDAPDYLILITYFLPVAHTLYFLYRIMKRYQISVGRKLLGFFIGGPLVAFLLFIPITITHTFLVQEQTESTEHVVDESTEEYSETYEE